MKRKPKRYSENMDTGKFEDVLSGKVTALIRENHDQKPGDIYSLCEVIEGEPTGRFIDLMIKGKQTSDHAEGLLENYCCIYFHYNKIVIRNE